MPSRRRTSLLAALALTGALAAPTVAHAETVVTIDGSVTQAKPGKPGTMKIAGTTRTTDGTQPPTAARVDLLLPRQLKIDLRGVPACKAGLLNRKGPSACPAGSRIGSGGITAVVGPIQAKPVMTLFYGGGRTILLYTRLKEPIIIAQAIEAKLTPASGVYGHRLTIPVPKNLQNPIATLSAAITDLNATVGGTVRRGAKRRSILSLGPCGPTGSLAFATALTLQDGSTERAASTTRC
jgi:hypothetical protein